MPEPRVLFVDDEPHVLIGVSRALRGRYQVMMAASGDDALQQLAMNPVEVVVSDIRMPNMDGAEFLARARKASPDTVRVVMSGEADLAASVRVINEGHVFRFLLKPVKRELLVEVLDAAIEQRNLVLAERELLERTLTGAVDALSEGLALTSPAAFGRGRRLKQLVTALAEALRLPTRWPLEVAAMLSQLGAATLPADTLRRWYAGEALGEPERLMVRRARAFTRSQVGHLPRLEPVLELLDALEEEAPQEVSLPARVLRVADALERRLSRKEAVSEALAALEATGRYDPAVLDACRRAKGLVLGSGKLRRLAVSALPTGAMLAEDVMARSGALLMSRGHLLTEGTLVCLRNFAATVGVQEPVAVMMPHVEEEPAAPARAVG